MAIRQSIIKQYHKGLSKSQIARNFEVSRTTIHCLIGRYRILGEQGLKPRHRNCGKARPDENDFIYRAVRCMRAWHPGWGGEKIHAELSYMRPGLKLPSVRTFYRWFHWNGQIEPGSTVPKEPAKWATYLHEGWQIDAKEEIRTADGNKQSWLNITDEHSGTVIDPPVFPLQENLRSTCRTDPAGLGQHFHEMGHSPVDKSRQWQTLWRPEAGAGSTPCLVAHRHGHPSDMEPCEKPQEKRNGGTLPGCVGQMD